MSTDNFKKAEKAHIVPEELNLKVHGAFPPSGNPNHVCDRTGLREEKTTTCALLARLQKNHRTDIDQEDRPFMCLLIRILFTALTRIKPLPIGVVFGRIEVASAGPYAKGIRQFWKNRPSPGMNL